MPRMPADRSDPASPTTMQHDQLASRLLSSLVRDVRACASLALMTGSAVAFPAGLAAAGGNRLAVLAAFAAAFCAGALGLARSRAMNIEPDSLRLGLARIALSVMAFSTLATVAIGILADSRM